jgi:hypothetical protein
MEAHPVCAEEREAGFFRVPLDGQLSREAGANGLKSLFGGQERDVEVR